MKEKNNKWILIAALAAVVAALTTVAVLALRARSKKKNWYDEQADFDYDLDGVDELESLDGADENAEAEPAAAAED